MEIVPSTFLAIAAVLIILIQGPRAGLWAFLCLAPLGAAAAFNLPAAGGATIGMKEIGVLALVLCLMLRPAGLEQMLGTLRPGQPGFPLALFLLYCALSAVFAPLIFRGATEIFSLSRDANDSGITTIPLRPTSGNITQLFSMTLGVLAYLCLATAFRTRPDAAAVITALAWTTALHLALGIADVASFAAGMAGLMEPLRSANYDILVDHRMIGLKRMIGGFPEASVFGAFSLALFAFWLQFWVRQPGSRLALAMMIVSLAVLLRSTSSGAYVALVVFLLIFGLLQTLDALRRRAAPQTVALTLILVGALWLGAVGLFVLQELVPSVEAFLNRALFDKLQTESGVERMSWNSQALQNTLDTWLFGAGLGSVRASNWLLASLSNVGVPGTALYLWFLAAVWAVPAPAADPRTEAAIMGLKAAALALMLNDLLTAGSPNQGVFFFTLAGLAVGLSRAGQLRRGTAGAAGLRPGPAVLGLGALLAALALPAGQGRADTGLAPPLAAASHFGQGLDGRMLLAAWRLGLRDLRDAVYWREVEGADGALRFDGATRAFPERLARLGMTMSLTVNDPHPAHDGGHTPASPRAIAAFARFAAQTAQRFPAITALEVGNEMNSAAFASGPGWGDLNERAHSYTALLGQTARQVPAGVRVLGGAAMAVPLAWINALSQAGALPHMDAFVLHPYTTAPEHLARQIALARRVPGLSEMPIEVTELGHRDAATGPGYLLRAYCQLALAGVTRVVWYPLSPRGDGWAPLLDSAGQPSETGMTARFILSTLVGQPVADIATDPFTFGCRFGPRHLLLWGAPRPVTLLSPDLQALSARGAPLPSGDLHLAPDMPLILTAPRPIDMASDLQLGAQTVIADSFYQFDPGLQDTANPFAWFTRDAQGLHPMVARPGQEKPGVPWTPYLGSPRDARLQVEAGTTAPTGDSTIVLRYTAAQNGKLSLRFAAGPSTLNAALNGQSLGQWPGAPDVQIGPLFLRAGDQIEVDLQAVGVTPFRATVVLAPG